MINIYLFSGKNNTYTPWCDKEKSVKQKKNIYIAN